MKTKTKHTPTPWNYHTHPVMYNKNSTQGAWLSNYDYEVAVHAVNNHKPLLDTVRDLMHALETEGVLIHSRYREIVAQAEGG